MKVVCPHCARRYLLPDRLLGALGARVGCPSCASSFEVSREPDPARGNPPPAAHRAEPVASPPAPVVRAEPVAPPPAPVVRAEPVAPPPAPVVRVESVAPPPVPVVRAEPVAPPPAPVVRSEPVAPPPTPVVRAEPEAPVPPVVVSEDAIARQVLAGFEDHGRAVVVAHARGRLFSEAGTALLGAFDEYRRRAGEGASAEAFRAALARSWGIDLSPERMRGTRAPGGSR